MRVSGFTDRSWRWGVDGVGLLVLMIVFVALRVVPAWSTLVGENGTLILPGNDPYYHLRQAMYSLEHFPSLLRWDSFSHYPSVLRNDAAGFYDLGLAALAKLLAGVSGMEPERALMWVCLWIPPLLGATLIPLVYDLGRRMSSRRVALFTASWLVLLPGDGILRTMFGFADHHVVEMVISVLMIRGWVILVMTERERPRPWWRPAWGAAWPIAFLQFVWLGAPLLLPILVVTLLGQMAVDFMAGRGVRPVLRAACRYWLGFGLLVGVIGGVWPDAQLEPMLWWGTLGGTVALLGALPGLAWILESPRIKFSPGLRLGGVLLVLGGAGGVVFFGIPQVSTLVHIMFAPKDGIVAENIRVTLGYYFYITSLAGILAILTPAIGVGTGAWRRPGWVSAVLPSLLLIALWCGTSDYGYQGALHAVILSGVALGALASARWWGGTGALAALTGILIFLVWPMRLTVPWVPVMNDHFLVANRGWLEATTWLREHTAVPSEKVKDARAELPLGRVGVWTDWNTGNLVATLAHRPVIASRYPEAEPLAPFFELTEERVRAMPLRGSTVAAAVRYVVIEPKLIGSFLERHLATIGADAQRYQSRESLIDERGRRVTVPSLGGDYDEIFASRLLLQDGTGLQHFRLIYESAAQSFLRLNFDQQARRLIPVATVLRDQVARDDAQAKIDRQLWSEGRAMGYVGRILSSVKIFEQVPGARLVGRVSPNELVRLAIPLRLGASGREFHYRQVVVADDNGNFEIIVPYSTSAVFATDTVSSGAATISWEGKTLCVEISETAVQRGGEIVLW